MTTKPEILTGAIAVKAPEYKYWAFISYSHRDKAWADWLHRHLERYYVPKALVGRVTRNGPLPARLVPIFRDRDELSAASDLGVYIKSSLFLSRHLIIICSRNSAKSKWVDGEVRYYKSLGRDDRIFCLIIDGEPDCGDPQRECFPEPARFRIGPDEKTLPEHAYPIAADARREGDGKSNALIKLLAGLLDVKYDELKQRERRRQFRERVEIVVLAALIAFFFFGLWRYEQDSMQKERLHEILHSEYQAETNGTFRAACLYLADAGALLSSADRNGNEFTRKFRQASRALIRETKILNGHTNWVDYCTFRGDGKQLLTCSWDSTVRTWDMTNLQNTAPVSIHTFKENSHDVFLCANYNDVGDEIVCSTWWSALAWVTDPDGGLLGRIIDDHRGRVNYAVYNTAGTQIVTASDDCTARIWDNRGNPIRTFSGHEAGVKMAVFNQAGTQILTAGYDGVAKIWDVATGKVLTSVGKDGSEGLNCADFSPDGKTFVAAGLDCVARLWNSAGGPNPKLVFRLHHARINSAMFSHRGDLVVTTSDDGTAKVWSSQNGALVLSLEGHDGPVLWAAFSPDDSMIATAGKDTTVRLWRLADAPPANLSWEEFLAQVKAFGLGAMDRGGPPGGVTNP